MVCASGTTIKEVTIIEAAADRAFNNNIRSPHQLEVWRSEEIILRLEANIQNCLKTKTLKKRLN